jgi:hypothetical protein
VSPTFDFDLPSSSHRAQLALVLLRGFSAAPEFEFEVQGSTTLSIMPAPSAAVATDRSLVLRFWSSSQDNQWANRSEGESLFFGDYSSSTDEVSMGGSWLEGVNAGVTGTATMQEMALGPETAGAMTVVVRNGANNSSHAKLGT